VNDERNEIRIERPTIRLAIALHRGLVNRVVSDHPGIEYIVLDDDFEGFDLETIQESRIRPESFDRPVVDPELKCVEDYNKQVDEEVKAFEGET